MFFRFLKISNWNLCWIFDNIFNFEKIEFWTMIKKQNNHVPLRPLSDQLRTIELKFFILSCSPTLIRQVTIIIYNAVFSEIRYIGNLSTQKWAKLTDICGRKWPTEWDNRSIHHQNSRSITKWAYRSGQYQNI